MRQSLAVLCRMGLTATFAACAVSGFGAGRSQPAATHLTKHALNLSRHSTQAKRTLKRPKMEKIFVYIGTYTTKGSKGIYLYELDRTTGALTAKGAVATTPNPTFLALAPNHKYLYAANEIGDYKGEKAGAISAFAIQPKTGALTLINQSSTKGDGPCHVSVDAKSQYVFAANYGGGSVCAIPIEKTGGVGAATSFVQHEGTSVDPARQEGPHAHSIYIDDANHFVYSADLGLDKVMISRFDAEKGTLTPNDPPFAMVPPGSGPRHIAFHPNGKFAYVINEMLATVTAMAWDRMAGTMKPIETVSTLAGGHNIPGNSTAEIFFHPSGKFLYGSNRGDNTIAIFSVDGTTGKIKLTGNQSTEGKTPRCFSLDPSGNFLLAANQDTDNVVVFRVNQATGALNPTGHSVTVSMPVCVVYLPEK